MIPVPLPSRLIQSAHNFVIPAHTNKRIAGFLFTQHERVDLSLASITKGEKFLLENFAFYATGVLHSQVFRDNT